MEKVKIGFDLGGTNMGSALVSKEGKILYENEAETLANKPADDIVNRIKLLIKDSIDNANKNNYEVEFVGMGCPGLLDTQKGIIKFSPNIPSFKNFHISEIISNEFNIPVKIDNDVRVAAIGEFLFGAGKGYKNIICITVGTGIGGAFILNGEIQRGPSESMGEVGHMTLKEDGPLCGCGNYGCLEALSSSTSMIKEIDNALKDNKSEILKNLVESGEKKGSYMLIKAIEKGDKISLDIFNNAGKWLGIGLSNLINIFNPELIIIGGGVSLSGEYLFKPVREEISKRALKIPSSLVKIELAQLGEYAGIIGSSQLDLFQ
jgi:glucokinase